MSKQRAARIANSPEASKHGGEQSHSGSGKATAFQLTQNYSGFVRSIGPGKFAFDVNRVMSGLRPGR